MSENSTPAVLEPAVPVRTQPTTIPRTIPAPVRRLSPERVCPDQIRRTVEPLFPMLPSPQALLDRGLDDGNCAIEPGPSRRASVHEAQLRRILLFVSVRIE